MAGPTNLVYVCCILRWKYQLIIVSTIFNIRFQHPKHASEHELKYNDLSNKKLIHGGGSSTSKEKQEKLFEPHQKNISSYDRISYIQEGQI
jgi:hypothetical protein